MASDQASQHTRTEIQGEKREKGAERVVEEIMADNSPNLVKDINLYIQECHQTPVKFRFILRHIIIEASKPKCLESTKTN